MSTTSRQRFNELKSLYRRYYFHNPSGVIEGREYFELIYAVHSGFIFSDLGVADEKGASHVLRQSISLGLGFDVCIQALSTFRAKL